jgi:deazaflavin-dependent oxidoreductase (nitroreductase family)
MADYASINQEVIEDFRANGGTVPGRDPNVPLLLLHHFGARTGTERVNPLAYQAIGEDFAVFGSKRGGPHDPDWITNLRANPRATVEVGTDTVAVTARFVHGAERAEIWERQKRHAPVFGEYELTTSREIPVVVLER